MTNILVLIQQLDGKVLKASLSALNAALQISKVSGAGQITALCCGKGAKAAAESLGGFGVANALYSESPQVERYFAATACEAVLAAMSGKDIFVAASTSAGKDLAPRVAALLDAGQASDIVAVNPDGSLLRPMYAGDILADVELLTAKKVITVRASGFAPAVSSGAGSVPVEELKVQFSGANLGEVSGYELSKAERPELGDAEVVVSGGRALQSTENFEKYIFPLADAFGAAVGASRAAVDSGYAPNDWQVGQTGKIVAPNLYVAVGISGAIQHLAGMKDSKVIVAINKDGDAPIFEVADFGLVADLYQAVPELTAEVRKARSS